MFEFDPNRALASRRRVRHAARLDGEVTPAEAIGQLLNYLPIFQFAGGVMTELDADEVLNWATAGVGATALAKRWNSPLLVEINERTLVALLAQPSLLEALEQIEDFRQLAQTAEQVVTSSKLLKKAKREQDGKLDGGQRKEQSETARREGDPGEASEASRQKSRCSCTSRTSGRRR